MIRQPQDVLVVFPHSQVFWQFYLFTLEFNYLIKQQEIEVQIICMWLHAWTYLKFWTITKLLLQFQVIGLLLHLSEIVLTSQHKENIVQKQEEKIIKKWEEM